MRILTESGLNLVETNWVGIYNMGNEDKYKICAMVDGSRILLADCDSLDQAKAILNEMTNLSDSNATIKINDFFKTNTTIKKEMAHFDSDLKSAMLKQKLIK